MKVGDPVEIDVGEHFGKIGLIDKIFIRVLIGSGSFIDILSNHAHIIDLIPSGKTWDPVKFITDNE